MRNNRSLRSGSVQAVDVVGQLFPVVEMVVSVDDMVRFHALVDIVIRAVLHKGKPKRAGDLERGSPRAGPVKYAAGAAAGDLAEQRHPSVLLKCPRDQVAA